MDVGDIHRLVATRCIKNRGGEFKPVTEQGICRGLVRQVCRSRGDAAQALGCTA
jgi:hypothetical protein